MTTSTGGSSNNQPSPQLLDLYKLRAEDFERNFLSLRTVEWQVAFQSYVAYASIITGFFSLKAYSRFGIGPIGLAVGAILLLLVVLIVGTFWQHHILMRLQSCRAMRDLYFCELHAALGPELRPPAHFVKPRFAGWWAFVPMQIVHFTTFVALLVVILNSTTFC